MQIGGEYFPGLCKQLWILYVKKLCQGLFFANIRENNITALFFFAARWNEIKLLLFIIFDLATFYTLKKETNIGSKFLSQKFKNMNI